MTLLRTDAQVALNDLLVNWQKAEAQYRDSASYIEGGAKSFLLHLADEKRQACRKLDTAIRQHGDLPSTPDEDRETIENLFHRVHAKMARSDEVDVLEQHIKSEQLLSQQVADLIAVGQLEEESTLLHELQKQARAAEAQLRELLGRLTH